MKKKFPPDMIGDKYYLCIHIKNKELSICKHCGEKYLPSRRGQDGCLLVWCRDKRGVIIK